ncbi:MAG: LuxR C-terminal-related transcriptional regulator [Myxococcota bacterium]
MLKGLLAMIAPFFPEMGTTLPIRLFSDGNSFLDWLGAKIIAPLSQRTEPLTLVLDDFHLITNPEVIHGISWLIERLPHRVHLLLASRTRPELPLARLQVRGQVTLLGAEHLRFRPQEARSFYRDTMSVTLADEDVAALEQRTEGWAAALQLFALGIRAGASPADLARSSAALRARMIEQFVTDEVLARQPPDVRRFLLRTSVLSRLTPRSCATVTGAATEVAAQKMLRRLDDENLFVVRLDVQGECWRYHHLFAEVLLTCLERSDEPADELHRLACEWALDEGLAHEAFRHAQGCGDVDLAARVVLTFAKDLIFSGEHLVLDEWFDQIPEAVVATDPRLGVLALWARVLTGKRDQIDRAKQSLEHSMTSSSNISDGERREILANMYAALSHSLHLSAEDHEVWRLANLAEAHIDDPGNPLLVLLFYIKGTVLLARGRLDSALDTITDAAKAAIGVGNRSLEASATAQRVRVLGLMGRFSEADMLAEALLARADTLGYGFAAQQRGWIAICRGEFEQAKSILSDSIQTHHYLYSNDELSNGQAFLSLALEMLGDKEGADIEALRALDSLQGRGPRGGRLITGILAVHRDEPGRVRMVLRGNPLDKCPSIETRFWRAWMSTWLQARHGGLRPALHQAQAQAEAAERDEAIVFAALWRALEASVLRAMGQDAEAARAELRLEGSSIVLARALRAPLRSDRAMLNTPDASRRSPGAPELVGVEPLSERETQVLALMALGMSNRDIASKLFVALPTVKTHVSQILRKLAVKNRTEAVHRARQLGWLAQR